MALLQDVRLHGEILTDHVWMNCGKEFDPEMLRAGEKIRFSARVERYWKGYLGRHEDGLAGMKEEDLKLSYPLDVRLESIPETGQLTLEPLNHNASA